MPEREGSIVGVEGVVLGCMGVEGVVLGCRSERECTGFKLLNKNRR
jgi:hypothetical protein